MRLCVDKREQKSYNNFVLFRERILNFNRKEDNNGTKFETYKS